MSASGCAEPQDSKSNDDEVRESDSKDSSGKNETDSEGDGQDSAGDQAGSKAASMMQYRAGSRLKPMLLEASDGAEQFYGWYDSKLEIPCSFAMLSPASLPDESGSGMRCLPAMPTINNQNYYQDNGCTEQVDVLFITECADVDQLKYGQLPTTSCGEGATIHELKSVKRTDSGDALWHDKGPRDCGFVTSEERARMAVVELGSEVKASVFVSAKTVK